ncbi:hypothetical protein [Nostoc sp.]|uniref:hypothetical protein n=1 Tax=Nostoc sp. TaxID=1180 RepID=UPI002FFA791B
MLHILVLAIAPKTLTAEELHKIDAYWRACRVSDGVNFLICFQVVIVDGIFQSKSSIQNSIMQN